MSSMREDLFCDALTEILPGEVIVSPAVSLQVHGHLAKCCIHRH